MRYKKNGAPMIPVIIPMGISEKAIVLEIVSEIVRNIAPRSMDAGIVFFVLHPISILVIWGITRPTQPMTPDIATEEATMTTVKTITAVRRSFVFTPRERDSESLIDKRLILQERRYSISDEASMGRAAILTSLEPTLEREPIRKYVIDGRVFSGSAMSFTKLSSDENRELIMIPPSTRPNM